jgi:amino acid transporter
MALHRDEADSESSPLESVEARAQHDNSLARNSMGTRDLVLTVLAALAPLTLMVAVTPLHFLKGGSAVPGAFLLVGCVMTLFAIGFMSITRYVQNAGAFYSVIAKGLGKPIGSGAAMLALLSYNALQISTYAAFGLYASQTLGSRLGVVFSWWVLALLAVVAVTWFGFRGIHTSSQVLACILTAEILVLLVLAAAVCKRGGPEGFPRASFAPSNVLQTNKSGAMYALIFGAFMGFESTTIFSEEARGGYPTVRRATFIAVGFIAVFYALMTAVVVTGYGASVIQQRAAQDPVNLVVNLFIGYTPPIVVGAMRLLLLGSAFAALLALHNVANRYFYAMGRDRLLPIGLATTHAKHKSPWVAGVLQSTLAVVCIGLTVAFHVDPYLGFLMWGSAIGLMGIIFLWSLCSIAILIYMYRHDHDDSIWSTLIAPLAALSALLATLWLALANFSFLTGAGALVNALLIGLTVLAFAFGAAKALRMRTAHPLHYSRLAEGGNLQNLD